VAIVNGPMNADEVFRRFFSIPKPNPVAMAKIRAQEEHGPIGFIYYETWGEFEWEPTYENWLCFDPAGGEERTPLCNESFISHCFWLGAEAKQEI
jgi:hypothetical protein